MQIVFNCVTGDESRLLHGRETLRPNSVKIDSGQLCAIVLDIVICVLVKTQEQLGLTVIRN